MRSTIGRWSLAAAMLVACNDADDGSTGPDAGFFDAQLNEDAGESDGGIGLDTGSIDNEPLACREVDDFATAFQRTIDRWSEQDQNGGWPESPTVFVGSSSIRRWETLALEYTDYAPLQRGFGGCQLADVAKFADTLIIRHDPRAVVVFAGTNDIAAGVPPEVVIDRFRCLRHRVGAGLGFDRPIVFIGITPTPSRWTRWASSNAVNEGIAAIAATDPAVYYADVATPFLATGEPPSALLFVSDRLHLNADGYDLWNSAIRPVIETAVAASPPATTPDRTLAAGDRVLIDLGPFNTDDGASTPSPDRFGQYWNNWHDVFGGSQILAGEQIIDMVTTAGAPTDIDLVIAGGFRCNGRSHGGLLSPDDGRLGSLALPEATSDYFYVAGADDPGALHLRGLDPARTYTLRLFGARAANDPRVTRYAVFGAAQAQADLQTSGVGAGTTTSTTNDDTIIEFTAVAPDAWGHLFIDLVVTQGPFGYISILEIIGE